MIQHHKKHWLLKLFPDWVLAFTFNNHIFYRSKTPSAALVAHEVVHANQFKKYGVLKFLWIYCWKERGVPYRERTFEKEAYKISGTDLT